MRRVAVETFDGRVGAPESWLAFVVRELGEADRFVIVDDGSGDSYAQAFNNDGTVLLEYRDGSPQRHFQATGVGLDDVATALSQWIDGRRDFIGKHTWTRLTDWD